MHGEGTLEIDLTRATRARGAGGAGRAAAREVGGTAGGGAQPRIRDTGTSAARPDGRSRRPGRHARLWC